MRNSPLKALLQREENLNFIQDNLHKDSRELLLKHSKDLEKRLLIEQVAQRQRIRKKLPEFYQNPSLILPPSLNLAQASSSETAQLKAEWIGPGKSMVDLSGGLGIDCRHFAMNHQSAHYLELNPELAEIADYNFQQLDQLNIEVHQGRAEDFMEGIQSLDFAYMDPSRRNEQEKALIRIEDLQPNLLEILPKLKERVKHFLVKLSPMLSIAEYLPLLPDLNEIWIISSRNECKELCFYWNFEKATKELLVKTVNLGFEGKELFQFTWDREVELEYAAVANYLYLPNASILKGAGQDQLASKLGLKKLAIQSNLFTSDELIDNFPGRRFKVIEKHKPYAKVLKKKAFNVISRNFFEDAEKIRKKLQLKSAPQRDYLIATHDKEEPIFIEAELIL